MRNGIAFLLLAACLSFAAEPVNADVGRTPGQFAVSPSGGAQYSIPIFAPPGPHGVQPNIALTYNSQQGNGYVGVGWAVSGLSSIYRCTQTIAQDGAAAPVALATSDGYCMDGNRLRLTAGTYGTAGSTYQTEIANFVNVTAYGAAGHGPSYWQATDRNGWQYTYGAGGTTSNAQVLASGSTTADSWQLNEVKDPNGNTMTVTYLTSNVTGVVVPNVISWVPASHGSSSYNYTMTFNYGSPNGSVHGYVGGTPFNNTNILSYIAIAYQGTGVKAYYLTYSNTTTATQRYLLTQIEECAGPGQTNCLSPTNVSWQPGLVGVGSGTALTGTVGSVISTAYDFNGDGINDLLMTTSAGSVVVAFGGSSGYGTPVATGLTSTGQAIGDIDGSGIAGFLVAVSGTWDNYKWNGSSFVGTSTGISVATAPSPVLADVDGDGRADFVYIDSAGLTHVRLSTSTSGTVSFASDINTAIGGSGFSIAAQFGGSQRALHFWGSAQADLIGTSRTCAQYNAKGICIAYQYIYYALHFTGTTFLTAGLFPAPLSSPDPPFDFADYNDDGCTDILTQTALLLSACNGTTATSVALPSGTTAVGGMDWNGDGRRDVLVAQSSGYLGVVLSTGTGLSSTVINTSYSTASLSYTAASNLTGDGQDGLIKWTATSATYYLHASPNAPPDLLASIADGFGNSVTPTYVSIARSNYTEYSDAIYPYVNFIGPLYVVSEVVFSDPSTPSGTYNQSFFYYGAWTNVQGRGFQSFYGSRMIDSRNELWYYSYYERSFPYAGMDFEDVLSNNSGAYIRVSLRTPTNKTLETTTDEERYFPYFSNVTTTQDELGGAEDGDPITTVSTNYTYDIYGNALTIDKTVTDTDPGSPYKTDTWTTNITNTPDADTVHWCLGLLSQRQVAYSASIGGAVTRTKTFTPDTTNCRYTQLVTEPTAYSGAYKVTEAFTFDSFGNIATDTVTGANMPSSPASRVTSMNWGTTGQFLTQKIVPVGTVANPGTATTSWSYASDQAVTFGVPDSMTDPNSTTSNPIVTHWYYDGFGRKTQQTRPDSTITKWVWSTCTTYCGWSNSAYQIAQTSYQTNGTTVIRTDTNSYDPIDRVTQTAGPTVSGTIANVQTLYNSLGLKTQQSMPFLSGATAYQQNFYYDTLNRLTSMTRPISSTNSTLQSTGYAYAGRQTTITDPKGNTKTLITDVNGQLRKTTDALGYSITRAYDAAGSLTGITDNVGNTLLSGVNVVYGVKPFVTAAVDADRGGWIFTTDSLGERVTWKDANGNAFSMTYDAQSRPLSRTEPDLFTEWNYGLSTPSIGKLISECTQTNAVSNLCNTGSWLYNEARSYDTLGRPWTRSITQNQNPGNDTGGAFLYTLTYNATMGLPTQLVYPTSTSSFALTLQYGYAYGLLQTVTDTSDGTSICGATCVLWTAKTTNAFGEMTQETLGNGAVINRSFDAVTSWLTEATAGVGGGAVLLNQSYLQDENGNITQRQDGVHSLTESFSYDADNRLTCVAMSATCSGTAFTYDGGSAGPGNITSNSSVGTYTYPAAGQPRPHAVTSLTGTFNGITNPTFSYDANGNMIDRASSSQNITWFSSNYPETISATDSTGSEEVQFQYGPDRQRWKQLYTGGGTTETTYYVGSGSGPAPAQLEVVYSGGGTTYRYYISAGSEQIAVYSRSSLGTNTMNYVLSDHQGGVSALALNTGSPTTATYQNSSAFGQLRDSVTWSGNPTGAQVAALSAITRQNYTSQTWLGQSMGLNHMNGRVEDAILGRMLSPDPHIPDPTNAQSYNRYSYVNNNPLTETDPTGFTDKTCPAVAQNGACVAGTNQPPATGTMIPGYLPNGLGCSGNCTYTGLTGTSYTMAALMSGGSLGVSPGFVGTVSNLNSASPAGSSAVAAQGNAGQPSGPSSEQTDTQDMNPTPGVYPNARPLPTTADFYSLAANNGLAVYPNIDNTPTPDEGPGSVPSAGFQIVLISVNALGEIQEIANFNPSSQQVISTQPYFMNDPPVLLINYIAQQGWCCSSPPGASK
jgi:RHS repeat-associated protein